MDRPEPAVQSMRGMNGKAFPSDLWHAINEMKLMERDGIAKHEMKKDFLISNEGMSRPTLTPSINISYLM